MSKDHIQYLYKILPGREADIVISDPKSDGMQETRKVKCEYLLRGIVYTFLVGVKSCEGIFTYHGQKFARQGNDDEGSVVYFSTIGKCRNEYKNFSLPSNAMISVIGQRKYADQRLWQDNYKE